MAVWQQVLLTAAPVRLAHAHAGSALRPEPAACWVPSAFSMRAPTCRPTRQIRMAIFLRPPARADEFPLRIRCWCIHSGVCHTPGLATQQHMQVCGHGKFFTPSMKKNLLDLDALGYEPIRSRCWAMSSPVSSLCSSTRSPTISFCQPTRAGPSNRAVEHDRAGANGLRRHLPPPRTQLRWRTRRSGRAHEPPMPCTPNTSGVIGSQQPLDRWPQ